ncbi:agamous-like MADS-box protein AGL90 [Rhododendron vialii]|uniref:agamous-like MADS-box protein AGL90 n=1 Tax=Rhododendron vialii TaxID=182163 RepID=UPI00265ECBEA|nr:agamous-like MADS-box protein AGL90 [Rhododendron vialii]
MGRAKLSMALINSEKARYTTFQKRKKGLKKKTYELKTLCGVQVCLIIYGPKIDDRQPEPEIWPQDREEIQELIDVYRKQPIEERKRRTSGVPNFLEDRNRKVEEAIGKLRAKNNEAKYPTWDDRYNEYTEEDLMNFFAILENKIQEVKARVEFINGNPRLVAPAMMDWVNMGSNPRLEALAMVDRVKMESNPRLEAAAMVDRVNMESSPNESYFLPPLMPGLFNRRNMQWEVVHDQKMKKSLEVDLMPMHQYYNPFDHQQTVVLDQFDGCSSNINYVYNTTVPFDRQINYYHHNEDHHQRMIDSNMVVANTNSSCSVPRVPPAEYYGSNVQPFVAPYMQYPVMASTASSQVLHAAAAAASQISDEYNYDPVLSHELHDIKNHN